MKGLIEPRLSRRARELLTGYLYLLPVAIALGGTVLTSTAAAAGR